MIMKRIVLILCLIVKISIGYAQDPARAYAYTISMGVSSKAAYAHSGVIITEAGVHKLLNQQKKALNNFREQYDDYLSTLRNLLSYSAELYGIYHEVTGVATNISRLQSTMRSASPTNFVAAYYSSGGERVINNIINDGIKFATDVSTLFPIKNKVRLTEKERFDCIRRLRLRLSKMNQEVYYALKLIKYTTLMDTWYEVTHQHPTYKTRSLSTILKEAQEGWSVRAVSAGRANSK